MINICVQCGLYRADKTIDPTGPYAVCPACGHRHRFQYLPLLVVTGASGAGKTAVCRRLTGQIQDAVLLDSDILWRSEFNRPGDGQRDYYDMWLRVCKNIAQSGRPVILFGAGVGVPENLEACVERRYFSNIKYLALVCSGETLLERLRKRPLWRGSSDQAYIEEHRRFNQWFIDYEKQHNQPAITLIDTTDRSVGKSAREVEAWIRNSLS